MPDNINRKKVKDSYFEKTSKEKENKAVYIQGSSGGFGRVANFSVLFFTYI